MEVEQPDQITRNTSEKGVTSPVKKNKKKVQISGEQEENSEKNLPPEVPPLEDSTIVPNKNSETPTSEKSPTAVSPQNIEKRDKKEKKEKKSKKSRSFYENSSPADTDSQLSDISSDSSLRGEKIIKKKRSKSTITPPDTDTDSVDRKSSTLSSSESSGNLDKIC